MRFVRVAFVAFAAATLPAQTYRISTVAKLGANGDGGPATQATLFYPRGIAVGRDGTTYVSETGANRIRRVASNGIITTYAGTGVAGFSGDGGPAAQARLSGATDLMLDQKGNLYVLDANNGRVRKISPDGMIQTFAGKGGCAANIEGPATNLAFCTIAGLAIDSTGNLYISEEDGVSNTVGHRVWRVDATGKATIAAGPQDGLEAPTSIAIDNAGNLYIFDLALIYRKAPTGAVDTIAGSYSGLDHLITGIPAKNNYIQEATALAVGPDGNLYFSTGFGFAPSAVFVIRNGILELVTGVNVSNSGGFDGDSGNLLFLPGGLTFDTTGNLYISDYYNHRIRRLSPTGTLTTIAGTRTLPAGSVAPLFQYGSAEGIAAMSDGTLYFADFMMAQVRKISPDGRVSPFAGSGFTVFSGDGGPALAAGLGASMNTIAFDPTGNLYLHSYNTYRVREVTTDGIIHTTVGTGKLNAPLQDVYAVAADSPGILYYADSVGLHRSYLGSSSVIYPLGGITALAVSPSGVLYFLYNGQVSRLDNGTATVVAGGSKAANDGDPAVGALLGFPSAIAFDKAGNLYIAGVTKVGGPGVVWRVGSDGILHRIAGPTDGPESADGTPAASAAFPQPFGISVDGYGRVYLAEAFEIRVLVPDTGSGCTINPSSNNLEVPTAGGDFKINVNASAYLCPYAVHAAAAWIKPSVAGAAGSGPVTLTIDANTGGARQATVAIGAATITVKQAGATLAISGTLPLATPGVSYTATLTAAGGAPPYTWSLASGTLPEGMTLSAAGVIAGKPAVPGVFPFSVRVTDSNSATATQSFTLTVASTVVIASLVNAASGIEGGVAPGEMVVLYGAGLGPANLTSLTVNPAGFVDTQLAGTVVTFDGIASPLLYTSAGQVAAVVPYAVSSAHPQVTVRYQGQSSAPYATTLADVAPALFTADASGKGQVAALNEDGSNNGPGNGAKGGSVITLFATGEGQTSPAGQDGKPAALPLPGPLAPVVVTIGGQTADVLYAGGAPGEVAGVMQVNVRVPAGVAAGNAPVVLQVGTVSSRRDVTMTVQ